MRHDAKVFRPDSEARHFRDGRATVSLGGRDGRGEGLQTRGERLDFSTCPSSAIRELFLPLVLEIDFGAVRTGRRDPSRVRRRPGLPDRYRRVLFVRIELEQHVARFHAAALLNVHLADATDDLRGNVRRRLRNHVTRRGDVHVRVHR